MKDATRRGFFSAAGALIGGIVLSKGRTDAAPRLWVCKMKRPDDPEALKTLHALCDDQDSARGMLDLMDQFNGRDEAQGGHLT